MFGIHNLVIMINLYFVILCISPLIYASPSLFVGIVSNAENDRKYKPILESFTSVSYNITVDTIHFLNDLEMLDLLSERFEGSDQALMFVEPEYTFNSVLSCKMLVATCEYYNVPVLSSSSETLCFKQVSL